MDLLESLNLDYLPEEQTRVTHLSESLAKDCNLKLGINCCCVCASSSSSSSKNNTPLLECKACRRVKYCSEACRQKDTTTSGGEEDENEGALGHTSIICSLLRLCHQDEQVEANFNLDDLIASRHNSSSSSSTAAQDRVRSELESYPATLANILREAPCFQQMLLQQQNEFIIHIVGASMDAELWNLSNQDEFDYQPVVNAYCEALAQVGEDYGIQFIHIYMIGPECPTNKDLVLEATMQLDNNNNNNKSHPFRLSLSTMSCHYSKQLITSSIPKPSLVVFFNPGFTCPDYDWNETMELCLDYYGTTGILLTTNTEMEGIGDVNTLFQNKLLPHLPPLVAQVMDRQDEPFFNNDDDQQQQQVFFAENPYAGSRVRQSGTMANDVYVKNRWMLAAIFNKPDKRRQRRHIEQEEEECDEQNYYRNETGSVKKFRGGNTKQNNPALV